MYIYSDDEVKTYLESLHRRFVIVTTDKSANNYALIWKSFYINRPLVELKMFSNSNTKSYSKINTSKEDMINTILKYYSTFEMAAREKKIQQLCTDY